VDPTHCSFCGRSRAAVGTLVAGERAAICEECALAAVAVVDENADPADWLRAPVTVLLDAATALVARGFRGDARRVIAAALALAGTRGDRLLGIAERCAGLSLLGAARQALLQVPEGQRTDAWRLAACSVEYDAGDVGRAAAWLEEIGAIAEISQEDWAVQRLLRVACRLRSLPAPSPSEAQQLLRTLGELQRVLPDAHTVTALKRRAECLVHLGDAREAARILSKLDAGDSLDIDGAFVLAEALWMGGDEEAAIAMWRRVAKGSPELAVVRRAEQRLQMPPGRQGPYR
jgi:thioredoxin-like negative regulator of GroEL